jgi:hypothetical protein
VRPTALAAFTSLADLKARRAEMAQTPGGFLIKGRLELDPEPLETHGSWLRGRTEQGAPVIVMCRLSAEGKATEVAVRVGDAKTADGATAQSLLASIGAQLAELPVTLTAEERSAIIWRAKVDLRRLD